MEPISLIMSALTLITPFLVKTGEGIAEKVGEDVWNVIKKIFSSDKHQQDFNINNEDDKNELIGLLLKKMSNERSYEEELKKVITLGQERLETYYKQNINNKGKVEKQINIQNNKGDIYM